MQSRYIVSFFIWANYEIEAEDNVFTSAKNYIFTPGDCFMDKNRNIIAFDYLRVIALVMILYDHLGGFYNPNWTMKKIIDFFFAVPLNIIQDFGGFGVSLFFLISGFLFTYNGKYKNECNRTLRKIVKIYMGCLMSFLMFYILQRLVWLMKATYWSPFSLKQWMESVTLLGYFTGNGDVINGTTWFLIPLFLFYILRIGYARIYEKIGVEWSILILELVIAFIMTILKMIHFSVSSEMVFVYMPVAGMILGELFREDSKLSIKKGSALFLVNHLCMTAWIWVFARQYHDTSFYLVSFMYSVALVVLFEVFNNKFKQNKVISFLCKISLSVYLVHMTFGSFLLTVFSFVHIPFTISFVMTISIVFAISYIHMKVMDRIIK